MRVGRFIGRPGVVSLPAVEVGLGIDERVVRRHVAKLEAVGWLGREPWVWGGGSVAWLTCRGLDGTALGGLQPLKLPPAPTAVDHGVAVGWTAARVERRGRRWKSARELALSASVAQRIRRLADKVWLRSPEFLAAPQPTRDEIVELIAHPQPVDAVSSGPSPVVAAGAGSTESANGAGEARPATHMSAPVETRDEPAPRPPESPEAAAADEYQTAKAQPLRQ